MLFLRTATSFFATTLITVTFVTSMALAEAPAADKKVKRLDKWYTTHSIEKFPCMNASETEFLKRIIDMQKIEQRLVLLSDHRKQLQKTTRHPSNVTAEKLNNKNFICPPFKGVRNPYPQVVEFGKAATFERIKITESYMRIINGLSKNENWPMNFNADKGYFEGQTPRGTPTNLIPLVPEKGDQVRFLVQYLLWKDKTPPSLTLCYREDLHSQCNPYKSRDISSDTKPK